MRKTVLILLTVTLLAGCGRSYQTLPHALQAFRDGDYKEFLIAKKESDEHVKNAIQPDGDLCLTTPGDFFTYKAQYTIERLNHKELFQLPDEDRFLYAMKVAATGGEWAPGSFIERAPIRRMTDGSSSDEPLCQGEQEKMAAALTSGNNSGYDDRERYQVLWEWQGDLKARHGDQFDAKMHDAVLHLESQGYTVKWPTDFL